MDVDTPPSAEAWYGRGPESWKILTYTVRRSFKVAQQIEETEAGSDNPYGPCDFCRENGYECKTYTKDYQSTHEVTLKCSRCFAHLKTCTTQSLFAIELAPSLIPLRSVQKLIASSSGSPTKNKSPPSKKERVTPESRRSKWLLQEENARLRERLANSEKEVDCLHELLELAEMAQEDQELKMAELEKRHEVDGAQIEFLQSRLKKYKARARRSRKSDPSANGLEEGLVLIESIASKR